MSKAGGIIGIIAGVFSFIAAIVTLFFGGLGAALNADGGTTVISLGWTGVFASFLLIIFSAVALNNSKGASIGMLVSSIVGLAFGGTLVAICMSLSIIGSILALIGAIKSSKHGAHESTETNIQQKVPAKKNIFVWVC